MQIKSSGLTDVGLIREGNEDAFHIEDTIGLFVIADGMGGHLAGEVASHVAVDTIRRSYGKWVADETPVEKLYSTYDESLTLRGNWILSSIRLANRVVYEMASHNKQYRGMGTTVVTLLVTSGLIIAANVGDSRIYLVRNGHIERLSRDHTIVSEQVERGSMTREEAAISPLKHVLTKNLGSSEIVEPDIFEIEPEDNDRFILCSDGLTDLVEDEEILEMTEKESNPDSLCRQFVDEALNRGGHDNTTVIAVTVLGSDRRRTGAVKWIGQYLSEIVFGVQRARRRIALF